VLEERKENTKDILGDKVVKPTRDVQLPYDTFAMTNGSGFLSIMHFRRETFLREQDEGRGSLIGFRHSRRTAFEDWKQRAGVETNEDRVLVAHLVRIDEHLHKGEVPAFSADTNCY
jgi:CHASE1-domain containing sensor protein